VADDKVTSYIGGPNSTFVVVAGDDGESHRFDVGRKYANDEIPKSVHDAIKDGIPGHGFTTGTDATVEKHLAEAAETQAEAQAEAAQDQGV
jgi:hypothetical protein